MNKNPELRPLTHADNYRSTFFKKLGKPIALITFIICFEALVGQPAIRLHWAGPTVDPLDMSECTLMTFPFFEQERYYTYQPLITIVEEPETTIPSWLWDQAQKLIDE